MDVLVLLLDWQKSGKQREWRIYNTPTNVGVALTLREKSWQLTRIFSTEELANCESIDDLILTGTSYLIERMKDKDAIRASS